MVEQGDARLGRRRKIHLNMVEAAYIVTQEEFTEAQKLWCPRVARKIPGYWPMQLTGTAAGACLGVAIVHLAAQFSVPLVASIILYFLVIQWRKRAARTYQYEAKGRLHEQVKVRFDEAGYHDEKENHCGGWISWQGFSGWRETSTIFVLGRAVSFITVPKRPLSILQQEELRQLLQNRISNRS